MHIIVLLGAIIGGIGVWYWRFKNMHEVGSDVADAVGRVGGAYRRHKFRNKSEGSALSNVDNPALAAGIFLFALANENADGKHLAKGEVERHIQPLLPSGEEEEMIIYAEWAAGTVVDARDCIRRFKALWRDNLTVSEREELVEMATSITRLTSTPTNTQKLAIENLRTTLLT